jgi:DNA modification methylase
MCARLSPKAKPADLRLSIAYMPIDELKLNTKNPRRHDGRQIEKISASIAEFGFVLPAVIDRGKKIVVGNARILAAKKRGYRVVPVIQVEHLTDAQARAFAIADNRLCEIATWDNRLLAEELRDLSEIHLDFSLEVTGFDCGEIDFRIQSLSDPTDEDGPNDPAPVESGQPVSRMGDLWLMDSHRLLCADARCGESYDVLMAQELAAMVFTDPPYNVRVVGHASGLGKTHHREFPMAAGEMNRAEYTDFLTQTLSQHVRHTVDGGVNFACIDWRHIEEMLAAVRAAECTLINLCVWVKHNGGMGPLYRSQHELIPVFKSGKGSHRNNVQLGRFGRNRTNVWSYRGANDFGRGEGEGDLLAQHPTPKPVSMVADAILDCSERNDIVLDGFLGSGTTLIAAERTGRRCFGLELDPIYVDSGIRRWQKLTGKSAICAATGKTFDEKG